MTEHLRTDYDRMVGESYREYAARCRGRMLAAEQDRDRLQAELAVLRAMKKRAQERYNQPDGYGLDAWRTARYILGEGG